MRSLLVIDDRQIRQDAFSAAEKFLKKLDRIELDVQSFHDRDQKLFDEWRELIFQSEKESAEKLQDRLRELGRLHNWIIALSSIKNISMAKALIELRLEEARLAVGSAEERQKIATDRRARDEFVRRESADSFRHGGAPNDDFAAFTATKGKSNGDYEDNYDELDAKDREMLRKVTEMTDERLNELCRVKEVAFDLLETIVSLAQTLAESRLFLRVWRLTPQKIQLAFARSFRRETGLSLQSWIDSLRAQIADADREAEADLDDSTGRGRRSEGDRVDDTAHPGGGKRPNSGNLENLKLLYRKLVRKLHPDMQCGRERLPSWHNATWDRVQTAYRGRDFDSLQRLYRIVLVRQNTLSELTVAEIRESCFWLQDELARAKNETSSYKKSLAWGFSRRKNMRPLLEKIKKVLAKEQSAVQAQIAMLEEQHRYLEWMASFEKSADSQPPARHRTKRGATKVKAARKPTAHNPQRSFFDDR